MGRWKKITETIRREAAKPDNQRRARQLVAKLRNRRNRPR